MSPLSSLLFVLPVLGSGTSTDVAVGADVRDNAGVIPQQDGQAELTNRLFLQALTGIRVRHRRTAFTLRYLPRFTFQTPNPVDTFRPLIFHEATADLTSAISRRLSGGLSAVGSYGELSYADQGQIFDPGSSTVDATALQLGRVRAQGTLDYRLSKLNTLSMSASGYFQDGIDNDDLVSQAILPQSYQAGVGVSGSHQLSLVDALRVSLSVTRVWQELRILLPTDPDIDEPTNEFGLDGDMLITNSLTLTGGWTRNTGETSSWDVDAGVGLFATNLEPEILTIYPTFTIVRTSQFRALELSWTNDLSLGIQGMVDNANGAFRPLANFTWNIATTIVGDWTVGSRMFASTSATFEPLEPEAYETNLSWSIPVGYSITEQLTFDMGVTAGLRMGHYKNFDTPQPVPNYSGVIGLRYTTGTGSERGGWL